MVPWGRGRLAAVVGLPLEELGVVDAARHPGQRHRLEPGEGLADPGPARRAAAQRGVVALRDRQALRAVGVVAPGAGTALGDVADLVLRLPDPGPHRLAG